MCMETHVGKTLNPQTNKSSSHVLSVYEAPGSPIVLAHVTTDISWTRFHVRSQLFQTRWQKPGAYWGRGGGHVDERLPLLLSGLACLPWKPHHG